MALLLNIDTATEHAGVCLSNDAEVLAAEESANPKEHASFIQPAIQRVMAAAGYSLNAVDAISVTAGPGSYTGLRVGLSTAKGLCYALGKPLIMVNTLEVMALAAMMEWRAKNGDKPAKPLFCPMIDARRMEVFTAIYDDFLHIQTPPFALVLDESSLAEVLKNNFVIFSGSGSAKAKIINTSGIYFSEVVYSAGHLAVLAAKAFHAPAFADLAYSEPFYLKEFYKPVKKN